MLDTKRNELPTKAKRQDIFGKRFKHEANRLEPASIHRLVPLFDRAQIYNLLGGKASPTQEALVHLSQILRMPMEYLYPPLPEDDPYDAFPSHIHHWLDQLEEDIEKLVKKSKSNNEKDSDKLRRAEDLKARIHLWRQEVETAIKHEVVRRRPWAIVPVLKALPDTLEGYPDPDGPHDDVLHLAVPDTIDRRLLYALQMRYSPPSRLVQPNSYVVFVRRYDPTSGSELWLVSRDGVPDVVPATAIGGAVVHGPVIATLTYFA